MKVLPIMHRGIVFMHEDGKTYEMAPLQIFRVPGGQTVIRIGRNALHFTVDGHYDGNECKLIPVDALDNTTLAEAFVQSAQNRNFAPDEPYFQPGSPGYIAETSPWPPKN